MTAHPEREVEAFESTLRVSYEWIRAIGLELGQTHAQLCYRVLRAGLHVIRDGLPPNEAASFAAQLPMLIRGVFFEGWHPAGAPRRLHSADEIYAAVARELEGGLACAPPDAVRATFRVLEEKMDGGELRKVRHLVPEALRRLWPEAAPRATAVP